MDIVKIDRATWRRGGYDVNEKMHRMVNPKYGNTSLYSPKSCMMCCLGFQSIQLHGVSRFDLQNIGQPHFVNAIPSDSRLVVITGTNGERACTGYARSAMLINDDSVLSEPQRERKLKKLGLTADIKYVFSGKTPKDYFIKNSPVEITQKGK